MTRAGDKCPEPGAAARRALERFFSTAARAGMDDAAVVAMFETMRRQRGREAAA
jgi:hypothetical protein